MIELKVLKRDVKDSNEHLRNQGLVPAIIYSSDMESTPISVEDVEFRKVYREAGTSNIINTTGDITGTMCVVQDMQVHVVSGNLLHIDFKAMKKGETIEITVPIELVGESPAAKNSVGALNFANKEALIETIPSKIPDHLEADISGLEAIGDSVKISDITLPSGVTMKEDENMTVASIIALVENVEPEEPESGVTLEEVLADPSAEAKTEEESSEEK